MGRYILHLYSLDETQYHECDIDMAKEYAQEWSAENDGAEVAIYRSESPHNRDNVHLVCYVSA